MSRFALVVRGRAIEFLERMLVDAAAGASTLTAIVSGAATDKSALLDVAIDEARRRRFAVRRVQANHDDHGQDGEVLRRLFDDPAVRLGGTGGALLVSATTVILATAAAQPILVVVEDAHLADATTLWWLANLSRHLPNRRCAVLVSVCDGEPSESLVDMLAAAIVLDQ
jgi:hypothetical protein